MTTVVPADLTVWQDRRGVLVPPNESAIQVQFPNCGGYRVTKSWRIVPLDPPHERSLTAPAFVLGWISFLITIFGFFGLFLLSAQFRRSLFTGRYSIARQLAGYDCTCQLCGLRLVRQGAEQLRQEEEDRRRRRDD